MHRVILVIVFLLLSSSSYAADTVELLDGAMRFTLPAGYSRLSAEEMAVKFPRTNRPPFAAFADGSRNATIAFTMSTLNRPVTERDLPEVLTAMSEMFPRMMAGLVWHAKEVVTIRGRQWARLHFSADALDADVMNDMYLTAFRGELLGVNLTATEALWRDASPELASAFRSMRLTTAAP